MCCLRTAVARQEVIQTLKKTSRINTYTVFTYLKFRCDRFDHNSLLINKNIVVKNKKKKNMDCATINITLSYWFYSNTW